MVVERIGFHESAYEIEFFFGNLKKNKKYSKTLDKFFKYIIMIYANRYFIPSE